ncbi:MAG: SIS domain-containing protein [Acidobacteria bacterium]|nr:SIS domain-containing protein [Acidobacteriota bacterium]
MDYQMLISENIANLVSLAGNLTSEQRRKTEEVALAAAAALRSSGSIFWCGNGGSAADAQHLSAELIGRLVNNREPLSSIALNSDIAALTCIANDFGYAEIYARQLRGLGKSGDLLIVLSTSGNSENVLRCLDLAKEIGMPTAALLGKDGGKAKGKSDFEIVINSSITARIQEIHKLIGHTICQIIERELGYDN